MIGWVSHQWPSDGGSAVPGLLPGRFAGGAEILQESMRSKGPEVVALDTRGPVSFDGFDRLIVAGPELLTDEQIQTLVPLKPLVWLMSPPHRRLLPLLEAASPLVWASPEMMGWFPWAPSGEVCSGWFDTSQVEAAGKVPMALWAARNHPQKGRGNAHAWAVNAGLPFKALTGVPRETVLAEMGRASHFVLLPWAIPDPCPTTVIEAEIAGCEVVTNRLVGRVPVRGPDAVRAHIEGHAERFWGWL